MSFINAYAAGLSSEVPSRQNLSGLCLGVKLGLCAACGCSLASCECIQGIGIPFASGSTWLSSIAFFSEGKRIAV